jgi:pimeloyl-ACP methyl ester carboxylesterase
LPRHGLSPAHEVCEPDPTIRTELQENEIGRFDVFMVAQNRDIVGKTRRTKLPAIKLWAPDQEARVASYFEFSFAKEMERTTFDGPSLIVAGRQDSLSGYLDPIDLLPRYPRSTIAVLDAAGHGLTWKRPEVSRSLLQDWLARLARVTTT